MSKKKPIREKGKIRLSKIFQEFEKGQDVAIVIEQSIDTNVPKRMQGRTGKIKEKKGSHYMITVADQNKIKNYIINPIHLKKIISIKNK
jgi:ribosomal protein L21E